MKREDRIIVEDLRAVEIILEALGWVKNAPHNPHIPAAEYGSVCRTIAGWRDAMLAAASDGGGA